VLAVERHTDTHTSVVLNGAFSPYLLFTLFLLSHLPVALALNDEPPLPRRHQLLEHIRKFPRYLLERTLDRLILPLVQHFDELLDRPLRTVELGAPVDERVTLLSELRILLERFLVDMRVFLEGVVQFVKTTDSLKG